MATATKAKKPAPLVLWGAAWFLLISAGTLGILRWRGADTVTEAPSSAEIVARLKAERLLPARLSFGSGYDPYDGPAVWDDVFWRRVIQERSLNQDRRLRGDAPAEVELSTEVVLALAGGPVEWRQALASLEAVTAADPDSAQAWSDLAAVRYSLALEDGEPIGFLPALEAAERALELAPGMPEALFNRALCREALGLWTAAQTAWKDYLEEDDSAGWADEARERLAALRIPDPGTWPKDALMAWARVEDLGRVREIVRTYRSPSRRLLEEEIMADWGVAALAGEEEEAAVQLRAARTIAAAYEELSGDPLFRDAVAAIEQAGSGRRAELAAAHRDFGAAVEAIDQKEDIDGAERLLDAALPLFGDSPFAWRAELKRAIVDQRGFDHPEVLARLGRLRAGIGDARYLTLLGESYWVEGATHKFQDQLPAAADAYAQALSLFETTGETELAAGLQTLLAELLDATGQAGEVWRRLEEPLTAAAGIQVPRRLYQAYSAAAISAWAAGHSETGLLYLDELQPWVASNPQNPVDSRIWRARLLHVTGSGPSRPLELLAEARDLLPEVPYESSRRSLEAEILAVEGELAVEADPAAAVASLEKTLRFYGEADRRVLEKQAHLQLGRAWRKLGNLQAARTSFAASVDRTEIQRSQLDADERASLLLIDGEAFEQLIDLEVSAGNWRQALAWSEQRRARTLLDRLAGTGDEGAALLAVEEIQRQLPPDLTVIEYAAVGGRWLAWVITAREVRGIDLGIRVDDLAPRVRQWIADIQRPLQVDLLKNARFLDQALIEPLRLPAGGDLVIVPDGVLKDLPWAALFDGEQFLIERHPLSMASSANVFVRAQQRNREIPTGEPLQVLALGNPAFDAEAFPTLAPLPHSETEAQEIANLHRTQPFLRDAATRARFLQGAPESEIVQVSGHARTRPESPLDSALVLAGGVLPAREIQRLRFDRTRLIVLSACSTASGPSRGGEGAESLAQAFQHAGVPGVVATLWNVEDQPTFELAVAFHRRLLQEGDARRALQQAQLQFINRPIAAWAGFQLIGEASFGSSQP